MKQVDNIVIEDVPMDDDEIPGGAVTAGAAKAAWFDHSGGDILTRVRSATKQQP